MQNSHCLLGLVVTQSSIYWKCYSVVPLIILSLNLDIHQVVKNHKTIHYLSPQGERKQSSLLDLILLSGNTLSTTICQRIIWSHIILNVEWYVSPFTCWWMRAMFLLTFSPLGEKVYTNMVFIHQQVKKSTLAKIVKNCPTMTKKITLQKKFFASLNLQELSKLTS